MSITGFMSKIILLSFDGFGVEKWRKLADECLSRQDKDDLLHKKA
jgi:hypothetical protein